MEERLAFMVEQQFDAGTFKKRIGWKDDERKCAECGETREEGPHELDGVTDPDDYHKFVPSTNEVAYLYERLKGLVTIKHKKDCLDLPDKRYRKIICKPTASILRVAEAIVQAAPNAVTGMTLLRELSDGFQYREVAGRHDPLHALHGRHGARVGGPGRARGTSIRPSTCWTPRWWPGWSSRRCPARCAAASGKCPRWSASTREVPCPKDAALKMLLDENEEDGPHRGLRRLHRLGGSRRQAVPQGKVGRGAVRPGQLPSLRRQERQPGGRLGDGGRAAGLLGQHGPPQVAFVANPESGGMSLTLVEARMAVYWSNSWKPEYRVQSEDRIHRMGMDVNMGCTIVDLIHLPSDDRVLDVIRENRKLELMTMGEILQGVDWKDAGEEGEMSRGGSDDRELISVRTFLTPWSCNDEVRALGPDPDRPGRRPGGRQRPRRFAACERHHQGRRCPRLRHPRHPADRRRHRDLHLDGRPRR